MRRGGSCRFGCYEGHELQGDSSVTCQDSGLWTNEMQPYCKKLTCPLNDVRPADQQTSIVCSDENYYRSICTYSCGPGYDILPGFSRVRVCTKYGHWHGLTPVCVDTKPPEFENCPSVKKTYAERSRTFGRVWWDDPRVSDNSGKVYLKQTSGPLSGDELDVVEYRVTYVAYDEANNTAHCSFDVIVKQILCPTVYPLPYTSVVCPFGRIFGSSCTFTCDNGTAINGPPETQCEKQGSVYFYGQWTFGDYQPYCTLVSTCPELSAPGNGALACDVWMDGKFCQTFCREGYLFGTESGYNLQKSLLVCGDSGTWYPATDIPDCVAETRATASFKLGAVYYFNGPCESAKDEIKVNFIARFKQSLPCEESEKCTVENVEVKCGSSTDRRRRDTFETFTVSAEIFVSSSSQDAAAEILQVRQNLKSALRNESDPRLVFDSGSVSAPTLRCPEGFEPNYHEYKCAECPRGFFHNVQTNVCEKCPFGQYQPSSKQTSCTLCPFGTTTAKEGAYDEGQCEDACDPGYFSDSGIEPCSPCDLGSFSQTHGSRKCTSCLGDKITKLGAKQEDECYDFDLEFKEDVKEPASLRAPNITMTDRLEIGFCVFCTTCNSVLSIKEPGNLSISVSEKETLTVSVNGKEYNHEKVLSTTSLWKYFGLTVEENTVNVTVNWEGIVLDTTVNAGIRLDNSEIVVTIGGDGFLGSVSHLNIWTNDSDAQEKKTLKCARRLTGDLISWKQFADTDGDFVQTHSKCDDYDNCLSNPCQNDGVCTDAQESYRCSCATGFTGFSCGTNINDCQGHACDNEAACVDRLAGYDCLCTDGFRGPLCEIKVVDGGWSDWDEWGPCSATCGTGNKMRFRTCSNPSPDNGGKKCVGEPQEISPCVTDVECLHECDMDPTLKNGDANCTWSGTTRICSPFCNEGYDFDTDLYLDAVVCGLETGFIWNIKTEDNPSGHLPSCIEIQRAKSNTMYYKGRYNDFVVSLLTEEADISIKTKVNDKVAQTPCVQNGRCIHIKTEVGPYSIGDEERSKREVQYVGFTVYVSCDISAGTDECYNLLKEVKEMLDDFVKQLSFSVNVSSTTYDLDFHSIYIDGVSTCESGSSPVFHYCIPCGKGMYHLEDYCERCPRGTYQDEIGKTLCKKCPEGWSTLGLMSRNQSLCTVQEDVSSDTLEIWMIVIAVVVPSTICCLAVILLILYCKCRLSNVDQTPELHNPEQLELHQ